MPSAIHHSARQCRPRRVIEAEPLITRVKRVRFVLVPISDQTRGHGTHSLPQIWGSELQKFLAELK